MQIYDALRQRRARFRPPAGRPIGVYVCGITPYDTTHLGHAFTYLVFDVLIRHFEVARGWSVRYVQNLTDVDDDILRKAGEIGRDWRELGLEWTLRFRQDMAWLGLRPPDRFPGVSSVMPRIIDCVARLLSDGPAYAVGDSVYFSFDADREIQAEMGLDRQALLRIANERGNDPEDPNKRDPLDFVLWQAAKPGEPAWNSPWGPGRPGWHIECSSMALEHLGPRLDIHGGGRDLAFPHHACERAQCRPLVPDQPWTRIWMHCAMVEMDGRKMSKSLGNLVMLRELAEAYHPDAIRLYLLRHPYREAWSWSPERLAETEAWMQTLHAAIRRAPGRGRPLDPASFGPRFTAALEDDLNTALAIDVVLELADAIIAAGPGTDVRAAQDVLRSTAGRILGLRLAAFDSGPTEVEPWPEPEIADPDIARAD